MNRILTLLIMLLFAAPHTMTAQTAGTVLPDHSPSQEEGLISRWFTASPVPDTVFSRMRGHSYTKGCPVRRADLRYLRLLHRNADGRTQVGEMVCNKAIAAQLVEIFRALYRAHYRIERMVLIDDYGADDDRSMAANNTTCFNYRRMTGSRGRVSRHGYGMAVDINPLYNPYVKGRTVKPDAARPYAYRRKGVPMAITHGDICHSLFIRHGFRWGGAWRSLKDYQHFEKQ